MTGQTIDKVVWSAAAGYYIHLAGSPVDIWYSAIALGIEEPQPGMRVRPSAWAKFTGDGAHFGDLEEEPEQ